MLTTKARCNLCGQRGVEVDVYGKCFNRNWCTPIRKCDWCNEFEHECICHNKSNLQIIELQWCDGSYSEYAIVSRYQYGILFRHKDKEYVQYRLDRDY